MARYSLRITRHGSTQYLDLSDAAGRITRVEAQDQTVYQIIDKQTGRPVEQAVAHRSGKDLQIYLGSKAQGLPKLVVGKYFDHHPVAPDEIPGADNNAGKNAATFATSSTAVLPQDGEQGAHQSGCACAGCCQRRLDNFDQDGVSRPETHHAVENKQGYALEIVRNGKTRHLDVSGGMDWIQAHDQTIYRVIDKSTGQLAQNISTLKVGSNLQVYLKDKASGMPDFVLYQYFEKYPVSSDKLGGLNATFATSSANGTLPDTDTGAGSGGTGSGNTAPSGEQGYTLKIYQPDKIGTAKLSGKGDMIWVPVAAQSVYQIIDNKTGKVLDNVATFASGSNLLVYLNGKMTGMPDLVMQNYFRHHAVPESKLGELNATFATYSAAGALPASAPAGTDGGHQPAPTPPDNGNDTAPTPPKPPVQPPQPPQPPVQPKPPVQPPVEPPQPPKPSAPADNQRIGIRITDVDDNFLGADDMSRMVTLNGRIDTASMPHLNTRYNRDVLQSVTVEINGKRYEAGVDNETFRFKVQIAESELRAADGKQFRFHINHGGKVFKVSQGGWWSGNSKTFAPMDDQDAAAAISRLKVSLEGEGVSGNTVRANGLNAEQSQISGVVSGAAKTGDTVLVDVNGKQYRTRVEHGKTFKVSVNKADLLADSDHTVSAKVVSGSASAQDHHHYTVMRPQIGGDFVSGNGKLPVSKLPYFIANLDSEWDNQRYLGFLPQKPTGKAATLTYRFFTQHDLDNLSEHIAQLKQQAAKLGYADRHKISVIRSEIKYLETLHRHNPEGMSEANQRKMEDVLRHIEENSAVKFVRAKDGEYADITYYIHDLAPNVLGQAYFGGHVQLARNIFTGNKFDYVTAIHETLHSLGLKHPHRDAQRGDEPVMSKTEDHESLTVMSYNRADFVKHDGLRIYDMAYLHYRYGVNPDKRAGNDTYTFKAFNRHSFDGDVYIWDGGGVDTFDASAETQGVTVNLTPGSWIHSGAKTTNFALSEHTLLTRADVLAESGGGRNLSDGNWLAMRTVAANTFVKGQAFIGFGTQIENLIGSDYNDSLTGNDADNAIYGGKGDDVIDGGKGNDWLDGGAGADTLKGGTGNDSYIVDNTGDRVVENRNEGTDTVYSSLKSYTLGQFVENLHLIGSAKDGIGNSENNRIVGNDRDNYLLGGGGSDTLTGGKGKDTFAFGSLLDGSIDTITDFEKGSDKIGLSKAVFTALHDNMSNFGDYVRYDNHTGKLSYDADGHGSGSAVTFAHLQAGLGTLDQSHFTLLG